MISVDRPGGTVVIVEVTARVVKEVLSTVLLVMV